MVVSLLIPYAGGAEKVVVTILTMVISPLYIPSVWGLFSKRIRGRDLLTIMGITYIVGLSGKFTYAQYINTQVFEASVGFVLPVVLLAIAELIHWKKRQEDPGYAEIQKITHAQDIIMTPEMKKGVKSYSVLAIKCFVLTLAAIALLLLGMIIFTMGKGVLADPFVVRTSIVSVVIMFVVVAVFYIWQYFDKRK